MIGCTGAHERESVYRPASVDRPEGVTIRCKRCGRFIAQVVNDYIPSDTGPKTRPRYPSRNALTQAAWEAAGGADAGP